MSVQTNAGVVSRGRLLAVLGAGFGVAVAVGNTVGVGLLRGPGAVAAYLPEFWPFISVWIAGALYALLGANALSELGTMMPRSGGPYVFVRRGLGEYAGFVVGWSDWIATCGATAAVAMLVGEYAVALFPEARAGNVIALAVIASLTLVQWIGVRVAGSVQNAATAMSVAALVLFVIVCFWLGARAPHAPTAVTAANEGSLFLAFILAFSSVLYAWDGWPAAVYFSEEMRKSGSIPRALLGGVIAIASLHLVVILGILAVVSLPTIAGADFAAGVAVERLFGIGNVRALQALLVIVLLSAVSAKVLIAPRVLHAMAADGLFWRGAREVNRDGTPDIALLISSLGAALFVVTGTFSTVVATVAVLFVAGYGLSFLTLFVLRRHEPDAPRPWRAWGHPVTTAAALLGSIVLLAGAIAAAPRSSLHAAGLLFLSIPVYLIVRKVRHD